MGMLATFILMNIVAVFADELSDWGFTTRNEEVQEVLLSVISAEELHAQGLDIRLSQLVPVYSIADKELTDIVPPAELPLEDQVYHTSLYDKDGNVAGYALLRYNYYTPDSEYVALRIQQNADFLLRYDEQVRDRFEIVEMKLSADRLQLTPHIEAIRALIAQNGLDHERVTVRLVNLVDGLGYAYRVSDGNAVFYYLISQTRTREQYGLSGSVWMEAGSLQELLSTPIQTEQPSIAQTDEPPIGGVDGMLQSGGQARALHPWVIFTALALLFCAGVLFLLSFRKKTDN